ncbi:RNA 2'-phosphotransferase [Escherichia coli]|nr:RNA 2'-phosphotransferase [Escherichia coli O86:H8]EFA4222047.1 RNA 2'-phosphotransferase [Escherichia coli O151:H8]MBC0482835.1 RNA 2'-phosphotransferase [Escherichia coli]
MWKRLCAGLSCRKFINPVTMTSVNKNRKSRDENEMAKYNEKELADTSKFLSFVLRHKPEAIGIVLDREGWADIDKLILCALRHKPEAIGIVLDREGWADIDKLILCAQKAGKRLTRALLDTVVATSDKKRFSYSSDGRCIRAVQGHSTSQVAISFAEKTPPQFLYHGTASRFLDEIKKQGLIAGERHYVHLSADEATARKVGARHGSPVILTVKAQEMAKRGIPFWQAENGVWLTSTVAVEFLEW